MDGGDGMCCDSKCGLAALSVYSKRNSWKMNVKSHGDLIGERRKRERERGEDAKVFSAKNERIDEGEEEGKRKRRGGEGWPWGSVDVHNSCRVVVGRSPRRSEWAWAAVVVRGVYVVRPRRQSPYLAWLVRVCA